MSDDEIKAYELSLNDYGEETRGPACTKNDFRIDLRTPHSLWNQSAGRVFVDAFLEHHELNPSADLTSTLLSGFFVRIKSIRRDFLHTSRGKTSSPALRRTSRKRTVCVKP